MQVDGRWDEAGGALAERGPGARGGAAPTSCVLCTNTMHKVADAVEAAVDIPLLHLGDTTAAAVTRRRRAPGGAARHRASRWSSPSTATGSPSHGLEVARPRAEDRAVVHRIIYDELCLGVIREESREAYRRVIARPRRGRRRGRHPRLHRDRAAGRPSRTARSRSSRPPGCTSRRRSSWRWRADRGAPTFPSPPGPADPPADPPGAAPRRRPSTAG